MTKRRSSYTKRAALRYIQYYDQLITQIKNPSEKPQGLFLSTSDFGDVKVATLHNRFRDALNWLVTHNIDPNVDSRADYEYLAAVIRVEDEANGIRVLVLQGPPPATTVRAIEGTAEQADWKQAVESYLSNPNGEPVKIFKDCKIFPENLEWLRRITGAVGASFHVDGDKITVALS